MDEINYSICGAAAITVLAWSIKKYFRTGCKKSQAHLSLKLSSQTMKQILQLQGSHLRDVKFASFIVTMALKLELATKQKKNK